MIECQSCGILVDLGSDLTCMCLCSHVTLLYTVVSGLLVALLAKSTRVQLPL